MSAPEVRAVVLAAGHGRRLRPLTEFRPKPLIPVHGRSILAHSLAAVAELGCESAAINLHHFVVDAYVWRLKKQDSNRRIVEGAVAPASS